MGALIIVFAPSDVGVIRKAEEVAEKIEAEYGVFLTRQTAPTYAWRVPVKIGMYSKTIGIRGNALVDEDGFVLNEGGVLPNSLLRDPNKPTEVGVAIAMEFN